MQPTRRNRAVALLGLTTATFAVLGGVAYAADYNGPNGPDGQSSAHCRYHSGLSILARQCQGANNNMDPGNAYGEDGADGTDGPTGTDGSDGADGYYYGGY